MSNIKIEPLTRLYQIRVGDGLIIDGDGNVIVCVAKEILVSECGVEVVFKRKANKFFNVGMFLAGESWATEVLVVTPNAASNEDVVTETLHQPTETNEQIKS